MTAKGPTMALLLSLAAAGHGGQGGDPPTELEAPAPKSP